MLKPNPQAHYHFLVGIDPYSCGVIADPGFEIVHVTLRTAIAWREGFNCVDDYLRGVGRERLDLCGMELRCPTPFTMDGFIAFNREYCDVLKEWDLYVGDLNPLARTNVSPLDDAPRESVLYGFSYTRPCHSAKPRTFVIAGAGELSGGALKAEGILRAGETSAVALNEKAAHVVEEMLARFEGLGADPDSLHQIDVYTIHPIHSIVQDIVLKKLPSARRRGVHWYPSRPPIVDIEYEMDMRGVGEELYLDLRR